MEWAIITPSVWISLEIGREKGLYRKLWFSLVDGRNYAIPTTGEGINLLGCIIVLHLFMPQVMSQVATIFRYLFMVDISYYEYNVRPPVMLVG
jgi:hypothetical protein